MGLFNSKKAVDKELTFLQKVIDKLIKSLPT